MFRVTHAMHQQVDIKADIESKKDRGKENERKIGEKLMESTFIDSICSGAIQMESHLH